MIDTGMFLSILLKLLPIFYGIALVNYLVVFISNDPRIRRFARPTLLLAVIANLVYLLGFTMHFEHIPMVNVFQVLGGVGFAVAVIYVWVEAKTETLHTGSFVLGLVLVFQVLNAMFPKLDREVPEILQSKLFSLHVTAAVLGYSAFALAAVYGVLYLLQYRAIRKQKFGLVFRRLPSLDILDRMNYYASAAGFALLTLAIVAGAVWSSKIYGSVKIDPKVMVAILTWVVYGVSLGGRHLVSWQGPRMASSSVVGFLVILFSMFAVNFWLTKFHVFV